MKIFFLYIYLKNAVTTVTTVTTLVCQCFPSNHLVTFLTVFFGYLRLPTIQPLPNKRFAVFAAVCVMSPHNTPLNRKGGAVCIRKCDNLKTILIVFKPVLYHKTAHFIIFLYLPQISFLKYKKNIKKKPAQLSFCLYP